MTEHPLFLYKAFISHSGVDDALGKRLQQTLESYRIAGSLVGRETYAGKIPAHLRPVFRRRAEVGSRPLPVEVVNALFGSQFLVVIATDACAVDEQVNKEISLFKHYHGENRILYLIPDDGLGNLPNTARRSINARTTPIHHVYSGHVIKWSGKSLAHIVAYLLGISLDEAREAEAAVRRADAFKWAASGTAALILMSIIGLPLVFAPVSATKQLTQHPPSRFATPQSDGPKTQDNGPPPRQLVPTFAAAPNLTRKWPDIPAPLARFVDLRSPKRPTFYGPANFLGATSRFGR